MNSPRKMVLNPCWIPNIVKREKTCEDDYKNDDNDGSITGVDDEYGEEYEPTV